MTLLIPRSVWKGNENRGLSKGCELIHRARARPADHEVCERVHLADFLSDVLKQRVPGPESVVELERPAGKRLVVGACPFRVTALMDHLRDPQERPESAEDRLIYGVRPLCSASDING